MQQPRRDESCSRRGFKAAIPISHLRQSLVIQSVAHLTKVILTGKSPAVDQARGVEVSTSINLLQGRWDEADEDKDEDEDDEDIKSR